LINDVDELNVKHKDDDDQMMEEKRRKMEVSRMGYGNEAFIRATIDWKEYMGHFEKVQKDQLIGSIASNLLQTKSSVRAS
jgi:hypothetical protein